MGSGQSVPRRVQSTATILTMNESELRQKGYIRQQDGSWSKPAAVVGLEAGKPKPTPAKALASDTPKQARSKGRMAIVISLISCRHRMLDDDNDVGSKKVLRDVVAESLQLDDGDKRIRWQYSQCETRGREGVIVRIECV